MFAAAGGVDERLRGDRGERQSKSTLLHPECDKRSGQAPTTRSNLNHIGRSKSRLYRPKQVTVMGGTHGRETEGEWERLVETLR